MLNIFTIMREAAGKKVSIMLVEFVTSVFRRTAKIAFDGLK